ncbi:MAG: hypothetical protein QOE08_1329, partial [Thermoleophilaceae bacterium]|nr:hypothetical protein [Thermoleophilaceae bacterium]
MAIRIVRRVAIASTLVVGLCGAPASGALLPSTGDVTNSVSVPTVPVQVPTVPLPAQPPTVTVPTDPVQVPTVPSGTPSLPSDTSSLPTVSVDILPSGGGGSGGSTGSSGGQTSTSGGGTSGGSSGSGGSTGSGTQSTSGSAATAGGAGLLAPIGGFGSGGAGASRGAAGALAAIGASGPGAGSKTAPGVTPLAALLASQPVPADSAGNGLIGDIGNEIDTIVQRLPDWSRPVIALLLAVLLVMWVRSLLLGARTRRLERRGSRLMDDIEVLQRALVPEVPASLGSLAASVAYRPAAGLGAGGDFYDAWALEDGRVAIVVGDVSGHDREAITRAASARYTVRAYLKAGLEPRQALEAAGRSLDDESLDGSFATAVLAVHDPGAATLTYACAGHPPPILIGPGAHEPVTTAAAPPLGWGVPTGLRQTTVTFPAGSV